MYNVSDKYLRAVALPGQVYKLTGTIGDVTFDDSALLANSLRISNQASASTDVTFGSVYIGKLQATFLTGVLNIPRGSWVGRVINLQIGLQLEDGDFEFVPFQPFTIQEAEWSDKGITVTAVDDMSRFDRTSSFSTTSGTPESLLNFLCGRAGVTLGMTSAQIGRLPNGSAILGIDPESQGKLKTYRDILGWLAQALGSFATMDREGRLVLRSFTGEVTKIIDSSVRYQGGRYSDYTTKITGLSVTNTDATTSYYAARVDDGSTMNLGANPFLQLGLPTIVKNMREEVLAEAEEIRFTPYDITIVPDPAVDLGDRLTFPDGLGNGVYGAVMAFELDYKRGLSIEGFGKNPSLATAQSKVDKELSGLMSLAKESIQWFTFENTEEINVQGYWPNYEERTVATIKFGNSKLTDIDMWLEFKITEGENGGYYDAEVVYYLDGVKIDYSPRTYWSTIAEFTPRTKYHTLHYGYHLNQIEANSVHIFEARLRSYEGNMIIAPGDAHLVMSGMDLAKTEEWDGIVLVEDQIFMDYGGDLSIPLNEEYEVIVRDALDQEFDEVIALRHGGNYGIRLADDATVITQLGIFGIADQNNNVLITQDSKTITTEGILQEE